MRGRRPLTPTLVLLAGLCGLVAAPARAELVDIAWGADGRFAHRFQVAPGKFAELCGKLAQGAAVRWTFEAEAPLDFNIHYHQGQQVEYPVQQAGTPRADGTLNTTVAQDYCWMWTNRASRPVALRVQLAR